MRPNDYRNIIFDLGGVILNIDYERTISAFQNLGIKDFDTKYSQLQQVDLFDQYERGELSSQTFRNGIRSIFDHPISDTEIDEAWNAMLLDLPNERLDLISSLGKTKQLVLLSNTNDIHITAFNQMLRNQIGLTNLTDHFIEVYYSYEIGMRKPEARIFEHVLSQHAFNPNETLFIDDSLQHVEGAKNLGIAAYHLKVDQGETILDLF